MRHQAFSVYDSAAAAYLPPFYVPRLEVAVRIFTESANDRTHQFYKYPGDYTLFCVGEFDDNSGLLHPLPKPEKITSALEVQSVMSVDQQTEEDRVAKLNGRNQ